MVKQAVKELSAPFKPSLSIPRIALLWARLQTLQGELRTKIDHDFNALYASVYQLQDRSLITLVAICLILQTL